MTYIVFLPGIQGAELYEKSPPSGRCARVWPPHVFSCPRTISVPVSWLGRKTLRAGHPIDDIDGCVEIYEPLDDITEAAGFKDVTSDQAPHRRLAYGYDWRADLLTTAHALADDLDQVKFHGNEELILLAHSMGGLICRLLLESGAFNKRPWFSRIRRFYALSTPHLGSLEILAKHLRLHTIAGAKGDPRVVLSDPAFPAGYQLLPPPSCFAPGQRPLVLDSRGRVVDIYSPDGASALELNLDLLERAREVWSKLDIKKRPTTVKYRSFNGSRTTTVQQVMQSASGRWSLAETNDGDGGVPDWSLSHGGIELRRFKGEHLQFLKGAEFAIALGEQLSTLKVGAFSLSAKRLERLERVEVQTNDLGYFPLQPVHISVFLHGAAPWGADTQIDLQRISAAQEGDADKAILDFSSVGGARMPLADGLRITLPAPEEPGAYRVALRIKGILVGASTAFVVSARSETPEDLEFSPLPDASETSKRRATPKKARRRAPR